MDGAPETIICRLWKANALLGLEEVLSSTKGYENGSEQLSWFEIKHRKEIMTDFLVAGMLEAILIFCVEIRGAMMGTGHENSFGQLHLNHRGLLSCFL